jgi:hypothetical protein
VWLAVIGATVVAVVGALLISNQLDDGPSSTARAPAAPVPVSPTAQAAIAWVSANLPPGTRVRAAPDAAESIRAAGLRGVAPSAAGCRANDYVLVTASLRSQAQNDRALASCIFSSLPVAVFARGIDVSEVRQITADPARTQQERQQTRADQRRGGAALVDNRAIVVSADVRRTLLAGAVDLRVQTVLAALSQHGRLRVQAVVPDPGEARAGMPARRVDVSLRSAATLDAVLAELSGDYRPETVERRSASTERLTWPFRVQPLPILK